MPGVGIDTANGILQGWLAKPDADEPRPGVLIVHDALGMTSDLRRQAEWLADAGFVTLAPDLYHWSGRLRCVVSTLRDIARGHGRAFDDIAVARDWLAARDDCTGRIGVIGYCLGGGFALLLATMGDYDAASVNYGAMMGDTAALADACPLVGSYGGRDRSMDDTPEKLEAALTAHGIPHDVKTYPDAGHGFLNDHDPDEMPAWARIPGRFSNTAFHEASAIDARRRIEAFFHAHLDDG
jgi:carboxymethylenebutenolidase